MEIPAVSGLSMTEIVGRSQRSDTGSNAVDASSLDELLAQRDSGVITDSELVEALARLRTRPASSSGFVASLSQTLSDLTGLGENDWQNAGQELLEAIMPDELGNTRSADAATIRPLGVSTLSLCSDFPMLTAVYGFSRCEYAPNQCWLRPFPPSADYGGRFPIFVDQVQADALLIRLNPSRVIQWLRVNGGQVALPNGSDARMVEQAFFVRLFENVLFGQTFQSDQAVVRMVFGLLHTLCHATLKEMALLCGLDRTSLSEHMLPRSLAFAIYCNHRFGATIGALTALFEQSLPELIQAVIMSRRCVYDPVCKDRESSCHACTHLPETSCRHFNLNLSRAFLFGGHDPVLGEIREGFLGNAYT